MGNRAGRARVDSKESKGSKDSKVEIRGISISSLWKLAILTFAANLGLMIYGIICLQGYETYEGMIELAEKSGVTQFGDLGLYATIKVILAAACVFTSALMVVARQSNIVAYLFMGTLFVASVGQIILGSLTLVLVQEHYDIICPEENCNPISGDLTPFQIEASKLELILFNECCESRFDEWSEEQTFFADQTIYDDIELNSTRVQLGPFEECQTPLVCPSYPTIVEDVVPGVEDLLCSCIPTEGRSIADVQNDIQTLDTCKKLEKVRIKVDSNLDIPTTSFSVYVVLNRYEWFVDNKDKVDDVPLVGTPGIPYRDPEEGFGCGLGFGKGYFWFNALFLQQTFDALAYTSLGCGSIGFLFGFAQILFVLLQYCGSNEVDDRFVDEEGFDDDYDKGYATIAPPAVAVEADQSVSEDELNAMLVNFYSTRDPSKINGGAVDPNVLNFALSAGIPALNQKLIAKYGVGISAGTQAPVAQRVTIPADFNIDSSI